MNVKCTCGSGKGVCVDCLQAALERAVEVGQRLILKIDNLDPDIGFGMSDEEARAAFIRKIGIEIE